MTNVFFLAFIVHTAGDNQNVMELFEITFYIVRTSNATFIFSDSSIVEVYLYLQTAI